MPALQRWREACSVGDSALKQHGPCTCMDDEGSSADGHNAWKYT